MITRMTSIMMIVNRSHRAKVAVKQLAKMRRMRIMMIYLRIHVLKIITKTINQLLVMMLLTVRLKPLETYSHLMRMRKKRATLKIKQDKSTTNSNIYMTTTQNLEKCSIMISMAYPLRRSSKL